MTTSTPARPVYLDCDTGIDDSLALAYLLAPKADPGENIAAILLDCMLPGADGFTIVRALREAQQYTPVLMLTARSRPEDVFEGIEAGADDYLAKPFDLSILLVRLKSLLRRTAWQSTATPETPPPVLAEQPGVHPMTVNCTGSLLQVVIIFPSLREWFTSRRAPSTWGPAMRT